MKYLKFVVFACLIFHQNAALGLDPDKAMTQYMQTTWTSKSGLPGDSITDLFQDAMGYIWIGTYGGPVRFDGVKFEIITKYNSEGFTGSSARAIIEDRRGVFWIGTNGNGVARLKAGEFSMFSEEQRLPNNSIRSLFEDRDGVVWVGTTKGVGRLKGDEVVFIDAPPSCDCTVEMFFQGSEGTLWFGSNRGGLYKLENKAFVLDERFRELSRRVILSMLEDREGNLWMGTRDHGVYAMKKGRLIHHGAPEGLMTKTVNSMLEGSRGGIWMGTDNGLYRFFKGKFDAYFEKDGLNNNIIEKILEDREGNLWVGTSRGGLAKLSEGKLLTWSVPEGLVHNKVNAILQDRRGSCWIGTDSGLSVFRDGKFIVHPAAETLRGVRIRHIYEDRSGAIWLSTYSDLGVLRVSGAETRSFSVREGVSTNNCRVTFEDSDGNIWVGTQKGLNRIRDGAITSYTVKDGLENDYIMCIGEDSSGNLWIGTDGGGVALFKDGEFTTYTTREGLAGNVVFKVFRDSRGRMLIAANEGVSLFKDGAFFNFTVKQGLLADAVFQIIEDDRERLWFTSDAGISAVGLDEFTACAEGRRDFVKMKLYDDTDGVRAGVTPVSWGAKDSDGRIWFPTMDGVARIDPGRIPVNRVPPRIFIKEISVDDVSFAPGEIGVLDPDYKRIIFKFTALSFQVPEKVTFQYMLEGFDETWSEPTTRRETSYTTLAPGEYVFHVKAANNDGVWSEQTARLAFSQEPYFYQTVWFYILVPFSAMGMVGVGFYLRTKTLRKRQIKLKRLLRERTRDLEIEKEALKKARVAAEDANRAKSEFLANMSHEIRTPMNAIIGLLHLSLATDLTARQHDYLTKIHASCFSLLQIINDILDFSKIEAGKMEIERVTFRLDDVLGNLSNLVGGNAAEKGLELLFRISPDAPGRLVGDPLRLAQVLINLTNNAVKFTETGEVEVSAALEKEDADHVTLRFSVRDTGVGLDESQMGKLFQAFSQVDSSTTRKYGGSGLGLVISKTLVEMMGGEISAESAPGKGSVFTFTASFGRCAPEKEEAFTPPPDLHGLHVLVVDDNERAHDVLREMLTRFSFRVGAAASGEEGIDLLEDASRGGAPYDLVLMDSNMPGVSGIEASRRIKVSAALARRPKVLLMSASTTEEMVRQAENGWFDAFLVKPFHQSVLFDAIMEALGREAPRKSRLAERTVDPEALKGIRGARILLVEDNELNQEVAEELLTEAGLLVTIADNGKKALEALKTAAFDLVLMDIQMPEMDGYQATEAIRADPAYKDPPIIAMTAHAMAGEREKCLAAGMNEHITKPVDYRELFSTLIRWIAPGERDGESAPRASGERALKTAPRADIDLESMARHGRFDVETALERVAGNKTMYLDLLGKFHKK
ncbi:MAG: response regulator, partial [Desulfobacterales bacterium]|nr:response regulator [Desulfobacterales bacterium]